MQSTSAKTLVDVQSGLKFAKSPRWIRQKLLFLDIHDRCIKSAELNGTVQAVRALPYLPGGFGVLADGGLIVGDARRRKIYRWESDGPKQMADLSNVASFCLSDGIVDSRGRRLGTTWITTRRTPSEITVQSSTLLNLAGVLPLLRLTNDVLIDSTLTYGPDGGVDQFDFAVHGADFPIHQLLDL